MRTLTINLTTKKAAAICIAADAVRGLEIGAGSGGYKLSTSLKSYPCTQIPGSRSVQSPAVEMGLEIFSAEVQNDWNLFHGSNRATGLQGRLQH